MKKLKLIILLIALLTPVREQFSQYSFLRGLNCIDNSASSYCYDNSYLGGQCKPESIDRYTTDPDAAFYVLIVYVQFQQDPYGNVWWWPRGGEPDYFRKLLSPTKISNPNWWEAYSEENARMSDYWMEVSRGKFHVIGKEVNIILDQTNQWYLDHSSQAAVMDEIYSKLEALGPAIDWPLYDQWTKVGSSFRYGPEHDGYVDMIYFIYRSGGTILGNSVCAVNHCTHSNGHLIYNQEREIRIYPGLSEISAGFQIMGNGTPLKQWEAVSFIGHEHGHYILGVRTMGWQGGHQGYGKINNYYGFEEFYSPYELVRAGWFQTKKVNFSQSSSYSLDDWTTRNTGINYSEPDEILEVPIGEPLLNQFFLIVNRQKISTYDKIMWGDTCHDDPYFPLGDKEYYGKGIYIYHAYPGLGAGYQWQIPFDQECADGLYNWVQNGFQFPDWSCTQNDVPYYIANEVAYDMNDEGEFYSVLHRDDKSIANWFALGKKVPCGTYLPYQGTDRIWTNLIEGAPPIYANPAPYEIATQRGLKGDRWDAWKVGYNEVFSPYSSPSTHDFSNNDSRIFIYLETMTQVEPPTANFKIYKVGEGGWTEEAILAATPPAKPMNLKVEHCYQSPVWPHYWYNKLTWNHNLEPDMKRSNGQGGFVKRYKVFKSVSDNLIHLPNENNYTLLATVDVDETALPSYVDESEPSGCNGPPDAKCPPVCWTPHATRYRVQAVDVNETPSVKSDFVSAFTYNTSTGGGIEGGDNLPGFSSGIPEDFNLLQNYPNPFNPSTEIKYALPRNTFVTIKIYDITGELVATLVDNEYKEAGYYDVQFDGTNISSGVYFYKMVAGDYKASKKMVLVK